MSESHADCVFCNIVNGKLPADKVYEDDLVVGFLGCKPGRGPPHSYCSPQTYPNPQRRKAGGSYSVPRRSSGHENCRGLRSGPNGLQALH